MVVKGKIIDNYGEPVVNAAVILLDQNQKRTTIGTSSDIDGNFYLSNSKITNNSDIEISSIGYYSIIDNAYFINYDEVIILERNAETFEPIVLVGGKDKTNYLGWLLGLGLLVAGIYVATKKEPKKVSI